MSWTVACFCGTVFEAPLDRCPTCNSPVPDVQVNAATMDGGSLERELAELTASAPSRDDQRRSRPVDADAPRAR
jgi:hypothetical protein